MEIEKNKLYEKLTIIIVLYNSSKIIFDCLDKIKKFKIIIVDNGKNENILNEIKNYSNIQKIISKNKNIGFGNGVNFAFKSINTDFFLVLNPDILLDEESILNLLKISLADEKCAISAPIIPSDNDGYGIFPERGKGILRSKNQYNTSKILENLKPDSNICVDVTKGCALLINSKYFKNVGMFSEKYFLFWEEIDLCRKFRKNKLSVIVSPNAIAYHSQGTSSKNDLKTYITRIYHYEISPLFYYSVKKNSLNLYWKILKYIFRSFSYLLILNFKKSLKNFVKLLANINFLLKN